jgi:hypothetical protein
MKDTSRIPEGIVIACPFRDLELARRVESFWYIAGAPSPLLIVDDDLVRARSRAVRMFLQQTDGRKLLFVDHDVLVTPEVIHALDDCNVDCIGATYPKKHLGGPDYAYTTRGHKIRHDGVKAEVPGIGFGCMLLSRSLLAKLWLAYEEELADYAEKDSMGRRVKNVMLFAQQWTTTPEDPNLKVLSPEDFSFSLRCWTLAPVHMYVRVALPHVGTHTYVAPPPVEPALDPPEVDPRTGVDPADAT